MTFPTQLFDASSSTYTYLPYRQPGGEAVIINPVTAQLECDLQQGARLVSSIEWERNHNSRLANREKPAFAAVMRNLNLAPPKILEVAVPANLHLGRDADR